MSQINVCEVQVEMITKIYVVVDCGNLACSLNNATHAKVSTFLIKIAYLCAHRLVQYKSSANIFNQNYVILRKEAAG